MILIFGGAYNGKKEYVLNKYGIKDIDIFDFKKYIYINNDDLCKIVNNYRCLYNIQCLIKELMQNNIDNKIFLDIIDKYNNEKKIIISDDISCGIVPIEPKDRKYREEVSKVITCLSNNAVEVYRIFAGLPLKIK